MKISFFPYESWMHKKVFPKIRPIYLSIYNRFKNALYLFKVPSYSLLSNDVNNCLIVLELINKGKHYIIIYYCTYHNQFSMFRMPSN